MSRRPPSRSVGGARILLSLAAVCISLSLARESRADTTDTGLQMQAPDSMLLGRDTSASITMRSIPKALRLYASVGTLTVPTEVEGRLTATYTPPSTRFPQVAIIVAATDDLSVVDFVTIPLLGQPTIRVASEPRAVVHVGVDGKKFGPLKLNRRGKGTIQLIVPPGVATATIHSADHLGNEKTEPHSLGVPAFQQLLSLCPQGSEELVVVAIDQRGRAKTNASLTLSADIGSLAKPSMRAPGIYVSRFQVSDALSSLGGATLKVNMPDAGSASQTSCNAQVPREPPSGLSISTDRQDFVAGSGATIGVLVKLSYPEKRLPRLVIPTVSVDVGSVSAPEPVNQDSYRIVWTLPDSFDGMPKATIEVGVIGDLLTDQAQVRLVGGKLANISLKASKAQLIANRAETTRVSIHSFDSFGNPVASENVRVSAKAGTLGDIVTTASGSEIHYRAPLRHAASRDTISARSSSGVHAFTTVLLAPAPRRILATMRVGYATNLGTVSTLALAADAAYRVFLGRQQLALGIESGYFSSSESRPRSDEMEDVAMRLSVVPVMARAVYEVRGLPIDVYAGGGAGILFASATIESPRAGTRVEASSNLGVSGLIGARKRLGRGLLILEAAYWHSKLNEAGLTGNIGGLRLTGGYGFDL